MASFQSVRILTKLNISQCCWRPVRVTCARTLITISGRESVSQTFQTAFAPKLLDLPLARYGGRQTVTALAGDGIGPEMMAHVKRVFSSAQVPVDFEDIALNSVQSSDDNMDNAVYSVERNGVALKGNIETKHDDPNFSSRNVEMRVRLDLYANVLRCTTIPSVPTRHKDIDIILIRQNTEGEYSNLEHETVPGIIESLKVVTRYNIERIAKFAFEYAAKHNRKKVTVIHKANIMKIADGLFLDVCTELSKEYGQIEFESMIVDNACMQMVQRPQQFDVLLMPNLYGNIISNIGCGLVGGPGLISGSNIGGRYGVFETGTRNTGSGLVGRDAANPVAFLRAAVDMLHYLGLEKQARVVEGAINRTLVDHKIHTADIGGINRTSEFVDTVVRDVTTQMRGGC